jgi:hypothetical protein
VWIKKEVEQRQKSRGLGKRGKGKEGEGKRGKRKCKFVESVRGSENLLDALQSSDRVPPPRMFSIYWGPSITWYERSKSGV